MFRRVNVSCGAAGGTRPSLANGGFFNNEEDRHRRPNWPQWPTSAGRRRRVQWHCSPHHQTTANYPVIEQSKRSIGLDDDDPHGSLERLEAMVNDIGLDAKDTVPRLARLLSIPIHDKYATPEYSPEEIKRRVLIAQLDLLLAAAEQIPVLFIIEDLHWADPSTVEVVGEMVTAIADSRVLMLMTSRPEFQPPWGTPSNGTTHRLNSLTKSETRALVRGIVEEQGLTAETLERIVERTDGVPLFIEEVTKNLLESSGDVSVPSSLQDSLMARLDRLGASKELAQIASVIGRSFALDALEALAERPRAAVEQGLAQLFDAGLVRRRTNGEHEFKHALVRDAAYDSMLRKSLRKLHERYASYLKASGAGERQPELLAQHYTEAGDAPQAIDYWTRAGDKALAHAALPEAVAHFQRALALLDGLNAPARRHSDELSVLLRLGQAQFGAVGGAAPPTMETFRRATELAQEFGSLADTCRAHYGRWVTLVISGRTLEALETSRKIGQLAVEADNQWAQAISNRLYGGTLYLRGQLHEASKAMQHVIASRDVLEQGPRGFGHDPYFTAESTLAHVEWALGFPEAAIVRSEQNLGALDPAAMNANTVSFILAWHLMLTVLCRRQDLLSDTIETLHEHSRRSGGKFFASIGMWAKGAYLIRSGQVHEGLRVAQHGCREYLGTGALQQVQLAYLVAAEGHIADGDAHGGLAALTEAEEVTTRTSQAFYEPEIHRFRGTALVLEGDLKRAQASYSKALEIAQAQDAKSWELRAATGLAELWGRQGKPDEAVNLLAPIYGWFTQGEDLPDIVDAKRLLEWLEEK